MGHESNFEKALYFTKCSVYVVGTWPPSRTASKWEIIKCDIALFISFISIQCICIPIAFAIYVHWHDILIVTQSAAMLSGYINVLIKIFVFRAHHKRMQILIEEMENFLKNLRPQEIIVLQRYFDRCSPFHTIISVMNYLTGFAMIVLPLTLNDQSSLSNGIYPFNVDSGILMYLVHIHQAVTKMQASAGICIDCQAALIMWFAGARLEMLAEEIANVSDLSEFQHFVRKHQKIMSYAIEISDTVSYVAFASSMSCGIAAIMCALQLVGNQPLAVKIQFALGIVVCSLNLFISAWPADNLIYVVGNMIKLQKLHSKKMLCDLLANAVYNASWFDMPSDMTKNLLMVLQRCQRPIIVSVSGFLPTLSLRSYGTFLSGLFSYFTAIRVVMVSEN